MPAGDLKGLQSTGHMVRKLQALRVYDLELQVDQGKFKFLVNSTLGNWIFIFCVTHFNLLFNFLWLFFYLLLLF